MLILPHEPERGAGQSRAQQSIAERNKVSYGTTTEQREWYTVHVPALQCCAVLCSTLLPSSTMLYPELFRSAPLCSALACSAPLCSALPCSSPLLCCALLVSAPLCSALLCLGLACSLLNCSARVCLAVRCCSLMLLQIVPMYVQGLILVLLHRLARTLRLQLS